MGQVSEETTFSYTNPAGQEESSTHMHTYTHTQVHRQTCRHKFTGTHTYHTHTLNLLNFCCAGSFANICTTSDYL